MEEFEDRPVVSHTETGGADAPDGEPGIGLREEVRRYYRTVGPYLDRTLRDRGDRPFWESAAGRWGGDGILELGAGTGRVTEVLARPRGRVVAVDVSLEMLLRARERLAGVASALLVVADMRSIRLAARFGLVAAANDPFSHLRRDVDRGLALRTAAAHLQTGGRLLLDALWLPRETRREAASAEGRVVERTVAGRAGEPAIRVREEWRCDPEGHRCTVRFSYRTEGGEDEALFRGRYWTPEEVERRLPAAGLELEALWGDYDRSPWSEASPHLIVVARRS